MRKKRSRARSSAKNAISSVWFLFFRYLNRHFLQQPFHCEIEHKIGLTCMTNGAVTCRVRLDRGGYVPGEAISIWATIANNSRVTIKHTRASLTEVKNLTFLGRKTRIKKMTSTWLPFTFFRPFLRYGQVLSGAKIFIRIFAHLYLFVRRRQWALTKPLFSVKINKNHLEKMHTEGFFLSYTKRNVQSFWSFTELFMWTFWSFSHTCLYRARK